MAFWNSTQITNIYTGATANDGSGDPIRDAFTKVDENFSNVSIQLSQFNQDWTNANIEFNLNANTANIGNLSIGSIYGNVNVSGTLLPTGTGFNLGTPSNPIGNIYASFQSINNTVTNTSTAGLFLIHATDPVTDIQDTGIFGNVYNNYGSNTYAFFGHQYTTNNFIYKITPTDATKGNNIVVGGVYGNAQFGSAFLSNSTPGGNTLVVNGNIGVTGTMYTNNGMVLTTNTPGLVSYSGTTIANVVITGSNTSTSPTTGALILSYGGLGVAGNVNTGGNVVAAGLVGPLYGTVMTAAQPNITSVGTLTSLNVGSVSATSVGATTVTVGGTLSMSGASLTGLSTLSVVSLTTTANTTSGNVIASGFYFANGAPFVSSNYGNTQVAAYLPTNATIYTLQANVGAFEITTNANIGGHQLAIASINANLGSYQNTTNANIGTQFNNFNTLNANVVAFEIYANANIGTQFNNLNTLTANVGAFHQPTSANIGTQFNNFNTLNANVGAYEIWANTSINSLRTSANANTAAYLSSFNGSIVPSANLTYNLGSSTTWWNNIYGTAIHAQYADLAERYIADADYAPGTVVVFGGDEEITVTEELGDERVAGAISTDPAYLMNGDSTGLAVALRGKVPVKLFGPVTKGDSLVTHYKAGYAISVGRDRTYGQAVFAKSLETNLDPGEKIVMAVII